MLTFDELVYAGGGNSFNSNYYLNNNATTNYWWTLSPYYFGSVNVYAFGVSRDGDLGSYNVNNNLSHSFRPAVSLKSSIQITGGNGTKANAYTIG